MILYHADTYEQLYEGQTLVAKQGRTPIFHLYPKGVCSYGERAFLKPDNEIQSSMQSADILFDYVRVLRFPDKPSRFTSVFASSCLEESKTWLERISRDFDTKTDGSHAPSTHGIPIYAVECDSVYIADAQYLDFGNALQGSQPSLVNLLPYALAYWESVQRTDTERIGSMLQTYKKPELLLVPPVRVLHRVYP